MEGLRTAARQWTLPLSFGLLLLGLLFSKFLLSMSVLSLCLGAAIAWEKGRLEGQPMLWSFWLMFGIVALSGLYSSDLGEWWIRTRVLLPFLLLPPAFLSLMPLSPKQQNLLLQGFILVYALALLGVLINYAADYERINESLTRSKAIPCPQADHIRFSLLLSLAFFATLHLWRQLQWSFRPTWGKIYAFLAVWLVLGLHILSVRSGLLALYLGCLAWLGLWIVETKRWTLGLSLILVVLSLPFLAYFGVESFRAKIDLSLYNLQLYQQGTIGEYSDTQRFLSYKIALQLAQEKPWFGWGIGDVWGAQQAVYRQDYPNQNPMFPHNQFLSMLVGTGILGLLAFVGAWLWPLWRAWRQPLVLSFFVVMGSSFLTENTLFITIGVNIYVFFGLLFYAQPKEEIKSAKE